MLTPAQVEEVKRLLAAGQFSQRKIARLTGVSRATIGLIAAGKRPEYQPRPPAWDSLFDVPQAPPERCPGCGGLVYLPCRLCHIRALKAAGRRTGPHGLRPAA